MTNISNILIQRGTTYGPFSDQAALTQDIKTVMKQRAGWTRLTDSQREALELIASKIARVINGDPNYLDSWIDIAGYARLIADQIERGES